MGRQARLPAPAPNLYQFFTRLPPPRSGSMTKGVRKLAQIDRVQSGRSAACAAGPGGPGGRAGNPHAALRGRARRRRIAGPLPAAPAGARHQPQPRRPAQLRRPLHAAHVRGAVLLHHLHLRLRIRRRAQPPRRKGAGAAARHPAIGARAGLPLGDGHGIHRPVSRQPAGPGSGFHFRHLHGPGVEHDLLLLPVAAFRAAGTRRDGHPVPPLALGALHAPGAARGHHRPAVERHDELRRRLVLPGRQRGHQRAEPPVHAARPGVVCGRRRRSAQPAGAGLGHPHHGGADCADRPALLEAAGHGGGSLQAGADAPARSAASGWWICGARRVCRATSARWFVRRWPGSTAG